MSQALRIFVISLARAAERRASMSAHLQALGLEYEMVDGVDGRELPAEEHARLLAPGVTFSSPGVVGCYMSHMAVYRRLVESGSAAALVLEDDAVLNPAIVPLLRTGLARLDFDYCFLDCADDREPVFYDPDARLSLGHGFTAYRLSGGPEGAHAMIVTREAAELRLSHGLPIQNAFDVYDMLPGRPRFVAMLSPRGAGVAMTSLHSMISGRREQKPPAFASVRRQQWFPILRDALRLRPIKGVLLRRRLQREGRLAAGPRWRLLPQGREVLPQSAMRLAA
jgi:Glycosyltransferase family 25 (LPS biosynthesis protein)